MRGGTVMIIRTEYSLCYTDFAGDGKLKKLMKIQKEDPTLKDLEATINYVLQVGIQAIEYEKLMIRCMPPMHGKTLLSNDKIINK